MDYLSLPAYQVPARQAGARTDKSLAKKGIPMNREQIITSGEFLIAFNPIGLDTVRVADIIGDGWQDVKIIAYFMGNGTASMNARVITLFQHPDDSLTVISYDNKMGPNQTEWDVDSDGNYEMITMTLFGYHNHNY